MGITLYMPETVSRGGHPNHVIRHVVDTGVTKMSVSVMTTTSPDDSSLWKVLPRLLQCRKMLRKCVVDSTGLHADPVCPVDVLGVITPNQIPLTTIVTYQNVTEAEFQTIGPLHLHAVWYLRFTNSPRKPTVTYHFSDLQEVYSDNRQIHTKCQLKYLHPPHISTSGICHCVIIHQTTKATEYIG